jgi:hypothetical protein
MNMNEDIESEEDKWGDYGISMGDRLRVCVEKNREIEDELRMYKEKITEIDELCRMGIRVPIVADAYCKDIREVIKQITNQKER